MLRDRYDEIISTDVTDDPQHVPPAILAREGAVEPESVLRSPVRGALHRGRLPWVSASRAHAEMTEALRDPDGYRARRRELRRTASRTLAKVARTARAAISR